MLKRTQQMGCSEHRLFCFPPPQPTDLQVSGETGSITASSSSMAPTIKMEDLALVVSNPHSSQGSGGDGEGGVLVEAGAVETITIGALSQDDAAEAIQGLQALAQRGVLEAGAVVEEQVQVSWGEGGARGGHSLVGGLKIVKRDPRSVAFAGCWYHGGGASAGQWEWRGGMGGGGG